MTINVWFYESPIGIKFISSGIGNRANIGRRIGR